MVLSSECLVNYVQLLITLGENSGFDFVGQFCFRGIFSGGLWIISLNCLGLIISEVFWIGYLQSFLTKFRISTTQKWKIIFMWQLYDWSASCNFEMLLFALDQWGFCSDLLAISVETLHWMVSSGFKNMHFQYLMLYGANKKW